MHSKAGYGTICNYRQFVDVHRRVPGIKVTQDEERHNRIMEFLSFVPERMDEQVKKAGVQANILEVV